MEKNRLLKKAIISFEEYERLVKEGVQKDILEQRIDKAIEYIENNLTYDENGCGCWWYSLSYYETPDELLEILKGDKNE